MDHHVFSIMAKTTPEGSMHREFINLPDIQASEEEYYSKGSGVYTGIGGATNAFQEYSEEKLHSLNADDVIKAGYSNRATVEFLFEAMFYPFAPTAEHIPALDGCTSRSRHRVKSRCRRAMCQSALLRCPICQSSILTYVSVDIEFQC
jgi:hypothetical protein